MWPTPLAKDGGRGGLRRESRTFRIRRGSGLSLPEVLGGPTNPEWIEWVMGFPTGWTDVEPSETPSSPRSPSTSGD